MSPSPSTVRLRLRTANTGEVVGSADGGGPRSPDLDAELLALPARLTAAALDGDLHRPRQILLNTDTKVAA